MGRKLTHIDEHGKASMVNIGDKPPMHRRAVAEGFFHAASDTIDRIMQGDVPKGEALAVARIAGIQAAKQCDALIPLCHSLPLDAIEIEFARPAPDRIRILATATTTAKTGVEMEALTAVSVTALTIYDMAKAIDRDLRIEGITLVEKTKAPLASDQAGKE